MNLGYERTYLEVKDSKDVHCGLVAFNYDQTAGNEFRAYIKHISVKEGDHLKELVSQVSIYI